MIRSPSFGFQLINIQEHAPYISIPASPTICPLNKLQIQGIETGFLSDDSCNSYDINLIFGPDIEHVYCLPRSRTDLDYRGYAIFDVEVRLRLMSVAEDCQLLRSFLDLG